MKKLAIAGVSVALMLAVAVPAFASVKGHDNKDNSGNKVTVTNNVGASNEVLTVANTGFNVAVAPKTDSKDKKGHDDSKNDPKGGSVKTGDALAVTAAGNVVGTTYINTCNTCNTGRDNKSAGTDVKVTNNVGADNEVATVANTGANFSSGGSVNTGDAAAGSLVVNVVGTTIVK